MYNVYRQNANGSRYLVSRETDKGVADRVASALSSARIDGIHYFVEEVREDD